MLNLLQMRRAINHAYIRRRCDKNNIKQCERTIIIAKYYCL